MSFLEEYYVADGRAKEVDVRVCLGLATPLLLVTAIQRNERTGIARPFFMLGIIKQK